MMEQLIFVRLVPLGFQFMENRTEAIMNQLLLMAARLLPLAASTNVTNTLDLKASSVEAEGSDKVAFHNLKIEKDANDKDQLRGSLKRIKRSPVYFGWLGYEVTDKQGKTLQQGIVDYTPEIQKRKSRRPSQFATALDFKWRPGSHQAHIVWTALRHEQMAGLQ